MRGTTTASWSKAARVHVRPVFGHARTFTARSYIRAPSTRRWQNPLLTDDTWFHLSSLCCWSPPRDTFSAVGRFSIWYVPINDDLARQVTYTHVFAALLTACNYACAYNITVGSSHQRSLISEVPHGQYTSYDYGY